MRALGRPRLVLTNHFDAHWEPLGPTQMSIDDGDRAGLAAFADEIHACAPETKVVVPTHPSIDLALNRAAPAPSGPR